MHGLKHGCLGFRRCSIDFVSQDNVGEYRTMNELKFPATLGSVLQNICPGDVHRHQVWSELNPVEVQRQSFSEFADKQGLG